MPFIVVNLRCLRRDVLVASLNGCEDLSVRTSSNTARALPARFATRLLENTWILVETTFPP
jgi:hypothetical protein